MTNTNLETISNLYDAFGRGDIETVLSLMAPDIVWNEAENNKLADRNPYVGPQAVLEGVFARLGEDFDDFQVRPERLIASDGQVAMHGRYSATAKATGQPLNVQVVHWYTLRDGQITGFQQYVDTLGLARVTSDMQ